MKKVYFAIYDMGAGHRSTANALKEVIESCNLPWEIEIVEVLKEVLHTTFPQYFYNTWVLKQKWAKLINDPISVPIFKARIWLMHPIWRHQLRKFWRKKQPDLVVSLMPLLNRVLFESLQAEMPDVPFVTSVTDFADCPKHFWIEAQNQIMICPSRRVVSQAKATGYSNDRLFQTSGVVIHPRYSQPVSIDRAAQRRKLNLHPEIPTGLVCFGSHGSREMLEIAERLNDSRTEAIQLIFVCGRNVQLAQKLQQMQTRYAKHIEGFTKELPTYMKMSDFFIGKPGSVGVSEAIALGLPVITECNNRTTLFQERATAQWLAENEFGLVVPSFKQIADSVQALLTPDAFKYYRDRVNQYNNKAAFEVIDILEKLLDQSITQSVPQSLIV